MTSSNEAKEFTNVNGDTLTVTGNAGTSSPNATYLPQYPLQHPSYYGPSWTSPQYQWSPSFEMVPHTSGRRTGHASNDPTIVNHCPFCGSGALTGRSDGGVDCGVCNETFRVSREPLYSNEPSAEGGAGVESFENDPLSAEEAFDGDGIIDAEVIEDEEEVPALEEGGDDNEEPSLPDFMSLKNRSGVQLDTDDFLLHHAIRSSRGE